MKRSILVRAIASTTILATTYSPMLGSFTGTVAAAETVQNTTYSYQHDANGNLTQVTDPMGRVSTLTYDPLNRVIQQLQPAPATGVAQPSVNYGYDALDQLSTVTDPRSLVTTYTNDGLGNQSSLVSPDSGTTGRTFDEAGNLITSTDARGKVTTYTYDVLNRLTKIPYASGTPTVFEYDGGASGAPNAIGRLTKMTDESGNTTYSYDQLGHLLVKTQTTTTGSTSLVQLTNYTYDDAGRLTSLTYPSGILILYTYDAAGHVNGLVMNPSDGKGNTDTTTNIWILQPRWPLQIPPPLAGSNSPRQDMPIVV
jgi:YD repeat-containing protein